LPAPSPQIPTCTMLSRAHKSNICALMLHSFDHLVSTSNDPMIGFQVHERPCDAPSVFGAVSAKPVAAGPDDDADGEPEDEYDTRGVQLR
jgi:hypothetical protein